MKRSKVRRYEFGENRPYGRENILSVGRASGITAGRAKARTVKDRVERFSRPRSRAQSWWKRSVPKFAGASLAKTDRAAAKIF